MITVLYGERREVFGVEYVVWLFILSEIELRDLVIVIYDRPIDLYYEFWLETITCRLVCCSLVSSFLVWKIKMRISIARD